MVVGSIEGPLEVWMFRMPDGWTDVDAEKRVIGFRTLWQENGLVGGSDDGGGSMHIES